MKPFVSVIVPTYQMDDTLGRCIEHILDQTYRNFELIIVDNEGRVTPPTFVPSDARIRWQYESMRGSYAARNRGLEIAAGEILAFTDADCFADPHWLSQGVAAILRNDAVGAIGGRVELEPAASLYALYDRVTALDQEYYIREEKFSVTANLFARRVQFDKFGPFDPSLFSGGDVEWCGRLHSSGLVIDYCHESVVYHRPRKTFIELASRLKRVRGGRAQLAKRAEPLPTGSKSLWRVIARLAECGQGKRLISILGMGVILRFYCLGWSLWELITPPKFADGLPTPNLVDSP